MRSLVDLPTAYYSYYLCVANLAGEGGGPIASRAESHKSHVAYLCN